jgi:hypothetical protein
MADTKASIILAATDQTRAAFASVRGNLQGIGGEATALAGKFQALGSVLALGLAGAKFKEIVDGIDSLNDVADATGASVERISALEDVAARTGTRFETVTDSLVKFNQALNAADPDSKIDRALKAIGLSAEELRKLDPVDALQRTAVALSGYADSGEKARLVQELFGRSVKAVAPLLKDLAAAGELNGKVTSEQAAEAERFNLQLFALQKNASDAARSLASSLLPALNQLLVLVRSLNSGPGLGASVLEVFKGNSFASASAGLDFYNRKVFEIDKTIQGLRDDKRPLVAAFNGAEIAKLEQQRAKLQAFAQAYYAATGAGADPTGRRPGGTRALPAIAPILGAAGSASRQGPARAAAEKITVPDDLAAAVRRLEQTDTVKLSRLQAELARLIDLGGATPTGAAAEAIAAVNTEIQKLQGTLDTGDVGPGIPQALTDALRSIEQTDAAQIDRLRDSLRQLISIKATGGGVGVDEAIESTVDQIDALQSRLRGDIPQQVESLKKLSDELGFSFSSAFEDAILKGAKFSDVLRGLAQDVLRILTRQFVTKPLADGIGSFIGSIFGSAKGNVFSGAPGLSAYSGTVVSSPTLFPFARGIGLMGEAGPEAILPLKRGAGGVLGVRATSAAPTITIVNQGTPQRVVSQQRLSDGEYALIVQDATERAVAAVSSQFGDPNSRVSRGFSTGFQGQRRR